MNCYTFLVNCYVFLDKNSFYKYMILTHIRDTSLKLDEENKIEKKIIQLEKNCIVFIKFM